MTCLPTTYDGYKAAIAWYAAAKIIANFDAGIGKKVTDKPKPMTTADAIAIVAARANARKG